MFESEKKDGIETYFRKNPIYYLDSVRHERQRHSALKKEESLPSERWLQFWGVILTILAVAVTAYILKQRNNYVQDSVFLNFFSLILIEAIILCGMMIAVIWEGFNSFVRDMESGVFETVMTTLLEPEKIVWGKFLHVFVYFLKFSLLGFSILFAVCPLSGIHPAMLLILLVLNVSSGCYMISQRIYRSADEAYLMARAKYHSNVLGKKVEIAVPLQKKIGNLFEKASSYIVMTFVFLQAQVILLISYLGDTGTYAGKLRGILNANPTFFLLGLFSITVIFLLASCFYFQKRTGKLLEEII